MTVRGKPPALVTRDSGTGQEKWKSKVEGWLATHPRRSLEERLAEYEAKYGLSSQEFYTRYMRGEYGDGWDYMGWAGIYQLYLHKNGFSVTDRES